MIAPGRAWYVTAHATEQLLSRLRLDVRGSAATGALITAMRTAKLLPERTHDGAERWLVDVLGEHVVALARREGWRWTVVSVLTCAQANVLPPARPVESDDEALRAGLLASLPPELRRAAPGEDPAHEQGRGRSGRAAQADRASGCRGARLRAG